MEISNKVPPVKSTAYVDGPSKAAQNNAVSPVAKGDQVELSAQARELQAAREAVLKMDDVDRDKVAKIKAQIEAGTYKIDADKIAGKMIEESLLNDSQ